MDEVTDVWIREGLVTGELTTVNKESLDNFIEELKQARLDLADARARVARLESQLRVETSARQGLEIALAATEKRYLQAKQDTQRLDWLPPPVEWGKLDHRGEFDELWLRNALVHVERMNETGFWIGIELPNGERISINTGVYRGEWFFNIDEDGGKHFSVRRPRNSKTKLPRRESLAQGVSPTPPQEKEE
jgi:hypothetical protein